MTLLGSQHDSAAWVLYQCAITPDPQLFTLKHDVFSGKYPTAAILLLIDSSASRADIVQVLMESSMQRLFLAPDGDAGLDQVFRLGLSTWALRGMCDGRAHRVMVLQAHQDVLVHKGLSLA